MCDFNLKDMGRMLSIYAESCKENFDAYVMPAASKAGNKIYQVLSFAPHVKEESRASYYARESAATVAKAVMLVASGPILLAVVKGSSLALPALLAGAALAAIRKDEITAVANQYFAQLA